MKLDYGCGDGGFSEIAYPHAKLESWLFKNGGSETYAIDINPLRIERAQQLIQNGTKFKVMDGRQLDFPDNYFDVVHEWGVFHHMPEYHRGIAEVYRVLKPGGRFLITESVDNDFAFRLARRVFDKWSGDHVTTNFTSEQLDDALKTYFTIMGWSYHWRALPADFWRQYGLEPRISLHVHKVVNHVLRKLAVDDRFCCHYCVTAVKR